MTAPLPPLSEGLYLYPPLLTNASGVGQIHLYVIHYLHQLTLLSDSVFLIMEICVRFIVRSSKLFKIVTVTKTILPSFWSYLRDLSFQPCANIFFTLYLGECCCPAVYIIPWISHQYPLLYRPKPKHWHRALCPLPFAEASGFSDRCGRPCTDTFFGFIVYCCCHLTHTISLSQSA